ncbi:MAG: hypothetical protein ACFE9I_01430 [Candidatus Hermodarchaeota archaeon]
MIQQHICQKCILPEGFLGIKLNSDRLCNFCADSTYQNVNYFRTIITMERKNKALKDWELVVKDMQKNHGQREYDCILGYSGGKDSTALLDYLVNDIGLTPLTVTSDTGFMTEIAKTNIKDTLDRIRVEHVVIEDCKSTFAKLYKWHFFNHTSNETFLARCICDHCSDLIHSIVVKEAIKREISYVLFGYSPDQTFRYFYEMPQKEVIENWMPDLVFNDPSFNEYDHRWYLTPEEIQSGIIPRVLLPYHIIPYREQDIIALVESKNYIKKGHSDPLLTNCNVIHAATFYDLNRYGGILYACQYAELVRQNPESRKKWLRTLKMVAPLILENKFKTEAVNTFFNQIGVTQEEIVEYINTQVEKDPNRNSIRKNIDMYRKKKQAQPTIPI